MTGGAGFIQPHNRDDGHHLPLHLVGSEIDFFIGDPNIQSLTVTETSVDVLGTLTVGGAGIGSVFDDRGKSIIATTESRTNVAYGTLTTPDQVTVTLAADGLLKVLFQATWQESVASQGRAAIFLDNTQVHTARGALVNAVQQAATLTGIANQDRPLFSIPIGLGTMSDTTAGAYPGDVTTGQVVGAAAPSGNTTPISWIDGTSNAGSINGFGGGPCYIFAAAGTYTISVRFKSASGSVTAKNRKLWVAAETY